ncbi:MAG: hypothetical protein V4560_01350 [Bacteroidota bacterium]
MTNLLDLYPLTSSIAFIQANINAFADEFVNWKEPLILEDKNSLKKKIVKGDLRNIVLSLCPLTTVEIRRFLILPTRSDWVAFLDNSHTGTDRTAPSVIAEKLKANYAYIVYNYKNKDVMLDYHGNFGGIDGYHRSIAAFRENRLEFYQYGVPLPFEKVDQYSNKRIKDRFNFELLNEYLKALGIDAFNEAFYDCEKGGILIDQIGPKFPATKELTLQQARDFYL